MYLELSPACRVPTSALSKPSQPVSQSGPESLLDACVERLILHVGTRVANRP